MILACEEIGRKLNSGVFPGTQGGPQEHVTAAKAVCLKDGMSDDFETYVRRIVSYAKVSAKALLEEGFDLVTGGTDNHLMLADLLCIDHFEPPEIFRRLIFLTRQFFCVRLTKV